MCGKRETVCSTSFLTKAPPTFSVADLAVASVSLIRRVVVAGGSCAGLGTVLGSQWRSEVVLPSLSPVLNVVPHAEGCSEPYLPSDVEIWAPFDGKEGSGRSRESKRCC
ncbi:hypothetical protein AHAS_Ahas18G0114500 [Arachis hypogaea]